MMYCGGAASPLFHNKKQHIMERNENVQSLISKLKSSIISLRRQRFRLEKISALITLGFMNPLVYFCLFVLLQLGGV